MIKDNERTQYKVVGIHNGGLDKIRPFVNYAHTMSDVLACLKMPNHMDILKIESKYKKLETDFRVNYPPERGTNHNKMRSGNSCEPFRFPELKHTVNCVHAYCPQCSHCKKEENK